MYFDINIGDSYPGGDVEVDAASIGSDGMIEIGQLVSWKSHGGSRALPKKGIVRAVIEPGERASRVCPELAWLPRNRRNFRLVSRMRRVLIEVPRDGRGCRHYSVFYAPPLSVVERSIGEGDVGDGLNGATGVYGDRI